MNAPVKERPQRSSRRAARVPSLRSVGDNSKILNDLGPLAELVGSWTGPGFNLIARPDFHDRQNLYLQLNRTHESLTVTPIGAAIPNRGFGQDDVELFGASYVQKIHDAAGGGALHFEPGLWVTVPQLTFPDEPASVTRMGSIPHGNALLASGTAASFGGAPVLAAGATAFNGSAFPSFNSTPFGVAGGAQVINAAGTDENSNAAAGGVPPFQEYDLTVAASATNPRTPFGTAPPEAAPPDIIDGVSLQTVVNDPISLLQATVQEQVADGCTFAGTVLNIASQPTVTFRADKNSPAGGTVTVDVTGAGGIENISFLGGVQPEANALTALMYATFWVETVTPRNNPPFQQLQYAQMVVLDFPIFTVLNPAGGGVGPDVDLGWPHVSVGTLRKSLDG